MKKRKEINNVTLYFASQRLAQGHAQRPQSVNSYLETSLSFNQNW